MDPITHGHALATKGFLDDSEGLRLYSLALEASRLGPCLEIGSYCGRSTIYLASACKESGGVLFSVDHHMGSEEQQPGELYFDPMEVDPSTLRVDTFRHFKNAIHRANLADTVIPVVATSALAGKCWRTPLGMIFIDGGHAHETVRSDYDTWSPHLLPDGYLAFHDIYPNPDDGGQAPYQIYRQAIDSGVYDMLPMTKTLGVLQKKGAGR